MKEQKKREEWWSQCTSQTHHTTPPSTIYCSSLGRTHHLHEARGMGWLWPRSTPMRLVPRKLHSYATDVPPPTYLLSYALLASGGVQPPVPAPEPPSTKRLFDPQAENPAHFTLLYNCQENIHFRHTFVIVIYLVFYIHVYK